MSEGGIKHGKQPFQMAKSYIVLRYLMENTDENHVVSADDICGYLLVHGISAERRSVYRDMDAINKAAYMLMNDCDIQEASEVIDGDEDNEFKIIAYKTSPRGYYFQPQEYMLSDIRLLAEGIYASKFISEKEAEKLTDIVCSLVSKYQRTEIKHNAFLVGRTKTDNKNVLFNINTINEAMSKTVDGEPHTPEKITFKYLKHTINNVKQTVERKQGEKYTVSPYALLINNSNYYLLAFDDSSKKMRTYRVDRMKNVSFTGVPREGESVFNEIDMKTYTQRVFNMYSGKLERVTIEFINPLLDAMIDRFGNDKENATYYYVDEKHSAVSVKVEISEQFFGWLLEFGRRLKLTAPQSAVDGFKAYMDKVREMYQYYE